MNTLRQRPRPVNGVILYEGPSVLDGHFVVCIATGLQRRSHNVKTGAMVQTYVLRSDIHPVEALRTKQDASICGDCPHRGSTCYVDVSKGPSAVWNAYRRGSYARRWSARLFANRAVRLGAYGDPAAVPLSVWQRVLRRAERWSGYTHQWQTCNQGFRHLCMASVDSAAERELARSRGWRTFRIRSQASALLPGEIVCPASIEAGQRRHCADCRACSGAKTSSLAATVTIVFHGAPNKVSQYEKRIELCLLT